MKPKNSYTIALGFFCNVLEFCLLGGINPQKQTWHLKIDLWKTRFLFLRIFQHTPQTYPRPPINSVWFGIPESFGVVLGDADKMPMRPRGLLVFSY